MKDSNGNQLGNIPVGLKFSQTQQHSSSRRKSVTSGNVSSAISTAMVA